MYLGRFRFRLAETTTFGRTSRIHKPAWRHGHKHQSHQVLASSLIDAHLFADQPKLHSSSRLAAAALLFVKMAGDLKDRNFLGAGWHMEYMRPRTSTEPAAASLKDWPESASLPQSDACRESWSSRTPAACCLCWIMTLTLRDQGCCWNSLFMPAS